MDKWISVEDGLPRPHEKVLTYNENMYAHSPVNTGYWANRMDVHKDGSYWDINGTSGGPNWKDRKPTHWMPLPQPPLTVNSKPT